jgi:putative transposase
MPNYRRAWVPGGCWFFTVNLLDRRSSILTDRIDALREATRWTLQRYPFHIDAFVVLPEHMHTVWSLPEGDADFSTRWRMIKSRFARSIPRQEPRSRVREARGERGIWQRRFWEHLIRDECNYARHIGIATSTRSSTPWCAGFRTGRIRLFIVTCTQAFSRPIGQARRTLQASSESGCDGGLRRASARLIRPTRLGRAD